MIPSAIASNPFAIMMEPELVLATMAHSNELRQLHHHEHHPLDKPLIPRIASAAQAEFDASVEAACNAGELDDDPVDEWIDEVLGFSNPALPN